MNARRKVVETIARCTGSGESIQLAALAELAAARYGLKPKQVPSIVAACHKRGFVEIIGPLARLTPRGMELASSRVRQGESDHVR